MGISVIFTAESDFSGYLIGKKLTPGVLEHITYQLPAFPGVDFLQRFIPYTDLPAQLPLIEIGDQPLITRVKELFPLPDGPVSTITSPARMSSVT